MMIEPFNTADLAPQNIIASANRIIPITAYQYLRSKPSSKNTRDQSMVVIRSLTLLGLISKYHSNINNSNTNNNKKPSLSSII